MLANDPVTQARIDLTEVAERAQTIPYEILTQVGRRVPRRVVD